MPFLPRRVLLVASTALLVSSLAFSSLAEDAPALQIEQYDLENGLTVVLAPTRNTETVSTVLLYEAGSADEPKGRSGFAHLFEHLMFEGTHAVPDYDEAISAVGGDNNAYTQWDSTTYHNSGPKEALPEFIRLEADRMANLANAVTQEDLDNQRAVVLNEMRQNTLDTPGGAAMEQAAVELAPPGHPYAHAVIGSIKDLEQAKLADVVAFHRLNYLPDRATLAISGNFDPAVAKADIEKTFGLIPKPDRGNALTSWFGTVLDWFGLGDEPALATHMDQPKTLEFRDAVTEPVVSLAWPGGEGLSRDTVENLLLSAVLSTGKSSLNQKLVIDQRIANAAGAGWEYRVLGGNFSVSATAAKDVSAEKLQAALNKTLQEIATDGISADALDAARAQMKDGFDNLPKSPLMLAMTLANAAAWGGEAKDWRQEEELAADISPADLTARLKEFLGANGLTVKILPGPRNETYPPVLANSTGEPVPYNAPARPDIVMPALKVAATAGVKLPAIEERKLANGAALLVYHTGDTQRAAIAMTLPGGSTLSAPALADLALGIGSRGIGELSLAELDQALKKDGIGLSGGAGTYSSTLSTAGALDKFDLAASYLADAIQKPRFDAKEWQAMIESSISSIEQRKLDPGYQALRGLIEQVFPADAPEARQADAAGLKALTMDQARSLFDALVQPERITVHVATSLTADDVKSRLDKALSGWKGGREAPAAQAPTRPVVREGLVTKPVTGATQSTVLIAMQAPEPGSKEATAFDLAVRILGGTFKSRLNLELREQKGWSYGISAQTSGNKGLDNTMLYIQAAVDAAHTQDSIAEIRRIVKALATDKLTDSEFDTARKTMKAEFLSSVGSADAVMGMVLALQSSGYTIADLDSYLKQIDALTLADVQAQADRIAALPMAVSVAGDPAKMK